MKKIFNFYFIAILIYAIITPLSILQYNELNYSLNAISDQINTDYFGYIGSIYIDLQYQIYGPTGTWLICLHIIYILYLIYRCNNIISIKVMFYLKTALLSLIFSLFTLQYLLNFLNIDIQLGLIHKLINEYIKYKILFGCWFLLLYIFLFKKVINIILIDSINNFTINNNVNKHNSKDTSFKKTHSNKKKEDFFFVDSSFDLPKLSFLQTTNINENYIANNLELKNISQSLLKHLNDFGVEGKIIDIKQGHVMIIFEFEPNPGIKNNRVISLAEDISRVMSTSSIRIAPIKNRNVLGIEIPKYRRAIFSIKELINNPEFSHSDCDLPIILGYNIYGKPIIKDLASAPHLLVAGTTGSGKSVGLNALIISLLYKFNPNECKFIMIDPKMLELSIYNDIPHLLNPVITDPSEAISAMQWVVQEMDQRYKLMMKMETRNIKNYNAKISGLMKDQNHIKTKKVQVDFDPKSNTPIYEEITEKLEKMPYIVVIVDEFADLMITTGKEIEKLIQRIAQKARAAGIHLIIATQRPSVNVVTGVIKANFPYRISFQVASSIDSRTIIDKEGAEKLLGKGDMLFSDSTEIIRAHCPFIQENEISQVVSYIKKQKKPEYINLFAEIGNYDTEEPLNNDNNTYQEAVKLVLSSQKTSISFIQRSLRIGFNRAASIVEEMEKNGLLSKPNDKGIRSILFHNKNID